YASIIGIGVWSMHFTGLLAYRMPTSVEFDLGVGVIALFISFLFALSALTAYKKLGNSSIGIIVSGFIFALGIIFTYYVSMYSVENGISISHLPHSFFFSSFIAITGAITSVWILMKMGKPKIYTVFSRAKIYASIAMTIGICGMHYVSMRGTIFILTHETAGGLGHIHVSHNVLAIVITLVSMIIIVSVFALTAYDNTVNITLEESNRKLEESKNMLRMVLDSIPVQVFWKDKDLNYLGCNKLFAIDAGLKEAEGIIGKSDYDITSREFADKYRVDDMKVIKNGKKRLGHEVPLIDKDGNIRWFEINKIPFTDIQGNITGVLGVSRDITKRKSYEEALKSKAEQSVFFKNELLQMAQLEFEDIDSHLEGLVELISQILKVERSGIWFFDETGSTLSCKTVYIKSKNFFEGDIKLEKSLYPKFFNEIINNRQICAKDAQNDISSSELKQKYLEPFGITSLLCVAVWRKGYVVGVLFVEHVGPIKEWSDEEVDFAMNASHLISLSLEAEDSKRAEKELKLAKESAEAANKAKSQFLSSMSHELRTPLNSILGFAQLMESDPELPLPKEHQEAVDHILRSGEHLLSLINDVLDLSKIEAGKMTFLIEPVNLENLIAECCLFIVSLAKRFDVEVVNEALSKELYVNADATRLRQVVVNLLSNAVKYNRPKGSVTISVEEKEDGKIVIHVRDTGMGIAQEKLEHLFDPFNRLGVEALNIEGTGIGLTITKKLVEVMNGELLIETKEGEGSIFSVVLEKSLDETKNNQNKEGERGSEAINREKPVKILYIEDNKANIKLMQTIIKRRPSVALYIAENGEEGINMAEEVKPDLTLLDINLPDIDGYEVKKRFDNHQELSSVPVIAMTANAMEEQVERGKEAGFYRYVTKPVNVAKFLDILDELCWSNNN
ncbi:MAG: response regulator, partial [Nitrospinae bacterium]|nr:response regulator [Nitrospinota bacterium]